MHVVIVGAGPAGILCAINLLRRNPPSGPPLYTVELIEAGEDYGTMDDLTKRRSWMIGLAWPGLRAIRRVPGLFDDYVAEVGVPINKLALYLGKQKMLSASGAEGTDAENYLVDRNFVVGALARYLNQHFGGSPHLVRRYGHKLNFVDADERRVHVRRIADGSESYVGYDLLVGADGVRSGVRAALVANHRDFELRVEDIFERFKSVHIDLPDGMESNCMHVFPSCVPNMNGIGLVETGNRINISMGHRCHAPCDEELRSDDASVVAAYLAKHFKPCKLPDGFAKAWVAQGWQSTTMCYCNFYHSEKLRIVLLGDAAHATSPSIGMGMNHALADAAVLDELLTEHARDLARVLPAYSALRVKEGNALTDVADLIQAYDGAQNLALTLRQAARGVGHALFPSLVAPEPYIAIGNGMKLSEAYAELTRMGRLPAVRRANAAIKQRHFEVQAGMIVPPAPPSLTRRVLVALLVVTAAIAAVSWSQMASAPLPLPPPPPPSLWSRMRQASAGLVR